MLSGVLEGQRYQAVAEPLRQLLLLIKTIDYRAETAGW